MGRHFRIIEGERKGRSGDGLGRRHRLGRVKAPYYWLAMPQGEDLHLLYPAPDLSRARFPAYPAGKRSKGLNGTTVPLTLVLLAAMLWGVWPPTTPGAGSAIGLLPTVVSSNLERSSFGICHEGGGYNCIVDGDTFYYHGMKIRVADIDTPETHDPQCAAEAERGNAATSRLQQLVNAGPFSLEGIDRDEDRYGRKLRVVTCGGKSLGGILVEEELARWYADGRRSWCQGQPVG